VGHAEVNVIPNGWSWVCMYEKEQDLSKKEIVFRHDRPMWIYSVAFIISCNTSINIMRRKWNTVDFYGSYVICICKTPVRCIRSKLPQMGLDTRTIV